MNRRMQLVYLRGGFIASAWTLLIVHFGSQIGAVCFLAGIVVLWIWRALSMKEL